MISPKYFRTTISLLNNEWNYGLYGSGGRESGEGPVLLPCCTPALFAQRSIEHREENCTSTCSLTCMTMFHAWRADSHISIALQYHLVSRPFHIRQAHTKVMQIQACVARNISTHLTKQQSEVKGKILKPLFSSFFVIHNMFTRK